MAQQNDSELLFQSAESNDAEFLIDFVKQGGDIDQVDARGISPLVLAIQSGSHDFALALLEHQPDLGSEWESSALRAAQMSGDDQLAKSIYESLILQSRSLTERQLEHAIVTDDSATIRCALRRGRDPDALIKGEPPLWLACDEGSHSVLRLLLRAGADPLKGAAQRPLLRAAERGDQVAVSLLIDSVKENPNRLDALLSGSGAAISSPLHMACSRHQARTVEALIEAGASTRSRDSDGALPIDLVVKKGLALDASTAQIAAAQTTLATLLASTELEELIQSEYHGSVRTLLGLAAYQNAGWAIGQIIERGLAVDIGEKEGNGAFLVACSCGSIAALDALAEYGASVAQTDSKGRNGFLVAYDQHEHIGLRNSSFQELLGKLLDLGCDPDQPDLSGRTARQIMADREECVAVISAYDARAMMRQSASLALQRNRPAQ